MLINEERKNDCSQLCWSNLFFKMKIAGLNGMNESAIGWLERAKQARNKINQKDKLKLIKMKCLPLSLILNSILIS